MVFTIRTFNIQDTNAVIQLWQDCELTRSWNDPGKDIQRKCKVKDDLFLVAIRDDKIVGSVMGGYDGHRGWINYLAVHPSNRKQGLGRQLMASVEKKLLCLGCPKINLQIRNGNHSVAAFYESIGFTDDQCTSYGKRIIHDE